MLVHIHGMPCCYGFLSVKKAVLLLPQFSPLQLVDIKCTGTPQNVL